MHVQITKNGLIHTPHQEWKKNFVLLLSMGSPDDIDAEPVIDLFEYMTETMGKENKMYVIKGTRLAVSNHVIKSKEELRVLYPKMGLKEELAVEDFERNKGVLEECRNLGMRLEC